MGAISMQHSGPEVLRTHANTIGAVNKVVMIGIGGYIGVHAAYYGGDAYFRGNSEGRPLGAFIRSSRKAQHSNECGFRTSLQVEQNFQEQHLSPMVAVLRDAH